jgi:putative solute:sodium symporter small subunit
MENNETDQDTNETSGGYRKSSLTILFSLLTIWFFVSFGCGILFREWLDQFTIGTAPLGFWMAQQGSIICFVLILIAYAILMGRLDEKHGYSEKLVKKGKETK